MQWLASISIRYPVLSWVFMLVIVVVGIVGYGALGVDRFPKTDFPTVLVTTRLTGSAPEEIETEVSDKIEGAVNTISGIDQLRSTSTEGVSQVSITFVIDKNPDIAAQEVRDKINNILPDLPKDIDQPVVSKVDPDAAPILFITLRSPGTIRDVTELADKRVRRSIESISGVGQVTIVGGRKRQINVWLDPVKLQASQLTAADVQRALGRQNLTVPGGALENGPQRVTLRVEGRVTSVEDIGRIVIKDTDAHAIRTEDVARVEDGAEEEETYASEDGKQTLILSVRKQSGENTVAVVNEIKRRVGAIQTTLPPGTALEIVRDNAAPVQTSVDAVKEHLILGSGLAALIVLVFLASTRSTVIAGLAIPISLVGTFALMWAMGFTLNLITLLALALAVGIVIDDAIVVLENILRHIQEKGEKPFPASIRATREIGLAVLATTLSLLAVFLPVSFMGGLVGQFLKSFGLTMGFAILVSLFVSFSLTPMLSARWLLPPQPKGQAHRPTLLERGVNAFYRPIEHVYLVILRWSMRHRWVIVGACVLALASVVPMMKLVKTGLLPEDDTAEFEVNIRAPEGTSLFATRLLTERIATEIRAVPGVTHTLLTIGNNEQKTRNSANVYVRLTDPGARKATQLELIDRVRNDVVAHQPKDLRIDVSEVAAFSTGESSASVQYTIAGPDLIKLGLYSNEMMKRLRANPAAVDVDSTLIVGNPEVRVAIDRDRAAFVGVDVSDLATTLQTLVGGVKATTFQDRGDDYDVRTRAEIGYRQDVEGLTTMTVPAQAGPIQLASVVSFRNESGPSQINRLGRQRQVTVTSNVKKGYGESDVQNALAAIVADLHLPPDYHAEAAGRSRETDRTGKAFIVAFAISLVFMYLVLAAQFGSWLHPVTIMVSLPLTIPFALLSLLIFGQALSIFTALGILVLFGVVKKNAILQIDHTLALRREGRSRLDAILESNKDRLRPILMTTLAFVAGMIPMLLSHGIGAGPNHATAGVVIGGQTFSLLLTLVATPVTYSLFDDAAVWVSGRLRRAPVDRGEAEIDDVEERHVAEPAAPLAAAGE